MLRTVPALISLVALAAVGGCGNAVDVGPPAGLTGISVTADGDFVIDAYVCRDKVDTIEIVRDRKGLKETEENPVVQTYTFNRPLTGHITVDLAHPDKGWTPRTPTAFEPGKGYIISGEGSKGYDNETSQLNIESDALDTLEPGSIYTSDDGMTTKLTRYTPAEFEKNAKKACA
jgi:hypothetical protein